MKSSITQIERHFDISTTHVGLIDGSFEMGNVYLLICVVSGKSSDSFLFPLGGRQPVVSGCHQPFWGPAAPTQVHFRGLFGHGSGGPPHRSDSLLHGTVNGRKHAISLTHGQPKETDCLFLFVVQLWVRNPEPGFPEWHLEPRGLCGKSCVSHGHGGVWGQKRW